MIVDLIPTSFFAKRGILDNTILGSRYICPLFYNNPSWSCDYQSTLHSIEESLLRTRIDEAVEHAEVFLACNEKQIPHKLESAYQDFIMKSSNYCGDPESFLMPLRAIFLNIHDTKAHFSNELKQPYDFCYTIGTKAVPQITALLLQRDMYPEAPITQIQPIMPTSIIKPAPTDTEMQEFRDRGSNMSQLQEAITNSAVRLILVSGAYGIGKTSTVAMTFKRHLPNWDVQPISLPTTISFSMVLEYIANATGSMLRADTLNRSSKKILTPIVKKFVQALFSKDGQAIVVDNMDPIFLKPQGRDITLITLFRDAVKNISGGSGKLIFISNVRIPKEFFPDNPCVKRIVIGRIQDNVYIKRILEYEMRKQKLVSPGRTPEISEYIYDIVSGHPLTAKLCVEVIAQHGPKAINDISSELLQSRIIEELMRKINLEHAQLELLSLLSVFRSTIDTHRLRNCLSKELLDFFNSYKGNLDKLSFVSSSEDMIELIAVFRNYYYNQIPSEKHDLYHECALKYYVNLHTELANIQKFSSLVYAEIAYHLTSLGHLDQLKDYLPGNLTTLKMLARTFYRNKRYDVARQLYSMLLEAYPKDAEVLSYLGRCYARKGVWDLVEEYFKKAIDAAVQKGDDTWYLYRDWGHLNVRYGMDPDATEKFAKARKLLKLETDRDDDASILSAEGFMMERDGDLSGAIEKYEDALSINYDHEFTIQAYANLLRRQGDEATAIKLEKRLIVDDIGITVGLSDVLPLDSINFDLDGDLYDE